MNLTSLATGNRALIIGYGAIGSAVGEEMRSRGRDVAVYDAQQERRILAERDGYTVYEELHAALHRGGLIVGHSYEAMSW